MTRPAGLAAMLLIALCAPAALLADVAPPPPSPSLAGGWSELRPNHPELAEVAKFVVPRLGRRNARLQRIEGGERQVVAGINYRIALQLADGSRWRAQVWKMLDGTYRVTRVSQVR